MASADRPAGGARLDHTWAKQVLALAMQAGEIMLRSGAETTRVEETVNIVARAFGFTQSHCLVTLTGIYLSLDDPRLDSPVTLVHRVAAVATHYSRVSDVNDLSRRIKAQTISLAEAQQELERIARSPDPYPFWLWLVAGASAAAGIALLLGGGLLELTAGYIASVLVLLAGAWLGRLGVPAFFRDMVGAGIATGVALGLLAAGMPIQAGLVIAGGIMMLVPGAALLISVHDGISGNLLSANARGVETLIKAAALASGVGLVLTVALRLGMTVTVENAGREVWQMPIQVAAAFFASAAYAVLNYVPRFAIGTAGLAGATGWLVYLLIWRGQDLSLPATFVAAFGVGLVSWGFARWQHAPITLYVLPGILPLLPGLTIYSGMLELARDQGVQGLLTLVTALYLGGALAAGVALSNALAPHIWRRWNPRVLKR